MNPLVWLVPSSLVLALGGSALGAKTEPAGPLSSITRTALRAASKLRGGTRVIHNDGTAYAATLHAPEGSVLRGSARAIPATVRLSHALKGPGKVGDALGLAVRVHADGGDEDLKLVTVRGTGSIGSRVIATSKSFFGAPYSSILPHGVGGKNRLVIATPSAQRPSGGNDFAEVDAAIGARDARFLLEMPAGGGRMESLGVLVLDRKLTAAESSGLKFRLWDNTRMPPSGRINRWRESAYQGSQSTR